MQQHRVQVGHVHIIKVVARFNSGQVWKYRYERRKRVLICRILNMEPAIPRRHRVVIKFAGSCSSKSWIGCCERLVVNFCVFLHLGRQFQWLTSNYAGLAVGVWVGNCFGRGWYDETVLSHASMIGSTSRGLGQIDRDLERFWFAQRLVTWSSSVSRHHGRAGKVSGGWKAYWLGKCSRDCSGASARHFGTCSWLLVWCFSFAVWY